MAKERTEENQMNAEIKAWTKMVRKKARMNLQQMSKKRTKTTQLKTKFKKYDGQIERVSFIMPKHLIFFHKGVGRGWPIGRAKKAGLKGGGRHPNPFLNPVLDQNSSRLADIVQKHEADISAANIKIK